MENIKIQLHPKQQEALAALETHKCVLYGGARGGGKSYFARKASILRALSSKNHTAVIFRRYYRDLKINHIIKFQEEHPELEQYFKKSEMEFHIKEINSRIMFRSINEAEDLEKNKGAEFHTLIIDEADQLAPEWIIRLRQSNRSSNKAIKPVTLLCGNPGGLSHAWLKRLFVEKKYEPGERPEDYAFIQAVLSDNPTLFEADPEYAERLRLEPNLQIRRAWLEGAWDIEQGQFFDTWNKRVHVVEPVDPEKDLKGWYKFGAMDWGYSHPVCFQWWAINPKDNTHLCYREYVNRLRTPHQVLQDLFKHDDTEELKYVAAGHDCWNVQRDGGPSVADQFHTARPNRLNLIEVSRDRVQGWNQMRAGLHWEETEGVIKYPKVQFTANCRLTIDSFPRIQHDRKKFEDCAKINCKEESPIGSGDDQIDTVRHAVMSRPPFNNYQPRASIEKKASYQEVLRKSRVRERLAWNLI